MEQKNDTAKQFDRLMGCNFSITQSADFITLYSATTKIVVQIGQHCVV
jgi:hypothetical protein